MNILDLLDEVRSNSGREEDTELTNGRILRWINRYKLRLQRDRRYSFSENTTQIVAKMNNRSTDLPSNFLQLIAIRRQEPNLVGVQFDYYGNQFIALRETVLHRNLDREKFLDRFPNKRADGELYVSAPSDYALFAQSILWGPIPFENESLLMDYYRLSPDYNDTDVLDDDFTKYYYDGLLAFAMVEIFRSWIPDKEKMNEWKADLTQAEIGLRKYQITREHPIETSINLPDN